MSDPPQNVSAFSFRNRCNVTGPELSFMRGLGDVLPLSDHPASPANETRIVATTEIIREEDSSPCSGDEVRMNEYIQTMESVSMKRLEDLVDSASTAMDDVIFYSKKPTPTNRETKTNQKRFASKSRENEEDIAKRNYEVFHSLPKGSVTAEMLIGSSAGIAGWASCKMEEPQQFTEDEESDILLVIAKQNYETFHSLSPGSATLEMLENSLAGIAGWAKNDNEADMRTKRTQSSKEYASCPTTEAPSHQRSASMVMAHQSPALAKVPSQHLAALVKQQEQELHYVLPSYQKDFDKEHSRQVSSFKDIKPEEIAGPAWLLQTPTNQNGDKSMDSLEAVNYDDAKHNLSDANVDVTSSSPSRRRGDEEERLQLRLALLESVGVQVDYGAKLLSLSHDIIVDDIADMFCGWDSEAQDEEEWSDEDEDDPEKREQDDSTKSQCLTTGSSDTEMAKCDQKSPPPPAENIVASSEDEVDKLSEPVLSTCIESIYLDSSDDDMDIASQGSTESFVVVATQEACDSSASTSSEWLVV